MSGQPRPSSIAEMPVQRAAAPATAAEARGRYFNTGNGFDVKLPPVPDHIFTEEPAAEFRQETPTDHPGGTLLLADGWTA